MVLSQRNTSESLGERAEGEQVFLSRNYKNTSLHFARKYARIFFPRTLSVPRSKQFSESVARGKL